MTGQASSEPDNSGPLGIRTSKETRERMKTATRVILILKQEQSTQKFGPNDAYDTAYTMNYKKRRCESQSNHKHHFKI